MYQQAVQAAQCHQPTVGVGDGGSGSQSGNAPVFLPLFMNPQTNPSMQYLSGKCFLSYLKTESSVILLSFLRVVQTLKHFKVKFKDT